MGKKIGNFMTGNAMSNKHEKIASAIISEIKMNQFH